MNPVSRSTHPSVQTPAHARHPEEVGTTRAKVASAKNESVRPPSGVPVRGPDEASALASQLAALFSANPGQAVAAHGKVDGGAAMRLVE